jgi:hypothetical protein
MTNPTEGDTSLGGRRLGWAVAYLFLVAAGVAGAWAAHELWRSGPTGESPVRQPRCFVLPPTDTADSRPATRPTDLVGALEGEGIRRMAADAPGIDPLPGAIGLSAFRMPDGSIVARYTWPGGLDEARTEYGQTLEKKGFSLLGRTTDSDGWTCLTFVKGQRRVIVALRNGPEDAKMVSIRVVE